MVCKTKTQRAQLLSGKQGISFTENEMATLPVKQFVELDLDTIEGVDFEIDETEMETLEDNVDMFGALPPDMQADILANERDYFQNDVLEKISMQDRTFFVNGNEYYFDEKESLFDFFGKILPEDKQIMDANQVEVTEFENGVIRLIATSTENNWKQELILHPVKYASDICNDIANAALTFEQLKQKLDTVKDAQERREIKHRMKLEAVAVLKQLGENTDIDFDSMSSSQIKRKIVDSILKKAHDLRFYKEWSTVFEKIGY